MSIVVGFIPTPEGRAALNRATSEAQLRQTELVIVDSHHGRQSYDAEESKRHERELEQVRAHLDHAGVKYDLRTFVRGNSPSEDLVTVAKESATDFIVIGLRRRSPVGKLVLGSNAQEILLLAECPVLAVKAVPEDQHA